MCQNMHIQGVSLDNQQGPHQRVSRWVPECCQDYSSAKSANLLHNTPDFSMLKIKESRLWSLQRSVCVHESKLASLVYCVSLQFLGLHIILYPTGRIQSELRLTVSSLWILIDAASSLWIILLRLYIHLHIINTYCFLL